MANSLRVFAKRKIQPPLGDVNLVYVKSFDSEFAVELWQQEGSKAPEKVEEHRFVPSTDQRPPEPDENVVPVVSAGEDLVVESGQKNIKLDGSAADSDGRIVRSIWKQIQGQQVQLTPDPEDKTIATFDAPTLGEGQESIPLMFEFAAEDDKGDIVADATIVTVGKRVTPPPPPIGNFPLNKQIKWLYSSDEALSHDGVYPTKKRSPYDPVLLFSNASGVKAHKIEDKKLIINKGNAFGRCYWEYYELPEYDQHDSKLGYTTVLTGTFEPTKVNAEANFSVKDGNHGTTGYDYDGQTFFGGWGFSFHEGGIESKAEGKHGTNGDSVDAKYADGMKLKEFTAYRFFATVESDQEKNCVILNVWMGDPKDNNAWVHTMKDRKWEKDSSDWKDLLASMPANGKDTPEAKKGPAFIRRRHCWTRANGADVQLYNFRIGTTL